MFVSFSDYVPLCQWPHFVAWLTGQIQILRLCRQSWDEDKKWNEIFWYCDLSPLWWKLHVINSELLHLYFVKQPSLLTGPAEPYPPPIWTVIQTNTSDKKCVCDTGSQDWSSQIPGAPTCQPRSSSNLWPCGIDWFLQPAATRVQQNPDCHKGRSLFCSPDFFFIVLLIQRVLNGICVLNQKSQTWICFRWPIGRIQIKNPN